MKRTMGRLELLMATMILIILVAVSPVYAIGEGESAIEGTGNEVTESGTVASDKYVEVTDLIKWVWDTYPSEVLGIGGSLLYVLLWLIQNKGSIPKLRDNLNGNLQAAFTSVGTTVKEFGQRMKALIEDVDDNNVNIKSALTTLDRFVGEIAEYSKTAEQREKEIVELKALLTAEMKSNILFADMYMTMISESALPEVTIQNYKKQYLQKREEIDLLVKEAEQAVAALDAPKEDTGHEQ